MAVMINNSPLRVLIADYDSVVRHLIASSVRKARYIPVEVSDSRQAYQILQADADFKAVIIDMMMPYAEGIEIIRYMRTEKRLMRIPVMMITGEQDLKVMTNSFAAGATFFLPKPFTSKQLEVTLGMLFSNRVAVS